MVIGYAGKVSVSINEPIDFYLSTDQPGIPHHFVIQRWGAPGMSLNLNWNLSSQQESTSNAWEGFQWQISHTVTIPANFSSGLYSLTCEGEDIADFVVRPETPGATSKILFQISFLTPLAYDGVGGRSLYPIQANDDTTRASRVSFDRPGCLVDTRFEKPFIQWLDAEGYAVEYCSSLDLHLDPNLLSNYDCLIIVGHDEYWTKPMRDNVEHFVANGGNFVVLSGNTCFRQVRLEDNERTLVFYKYAGADPHPDDTEKTVVFSEPPVNRPPNTLFGVGFDHGAAGWTPKSYTIHFPDHWAFNGLQPPATTPWTTSAFLDYEADAAAFVIEPHGYPRVTGTDGTPSSFVVLGSADLREWGPKPGFATMGIYSRGGTVFNAGTTAWVGALTTDPVVAQVTRNVLNRLRRPQDWDWELVGHAVKGIAMTALEGKLFLADSDGFLWRRYPVGANAPWTEIGHVYQAKALAGSGDTLYCISQDNQLWWRTTVEQNINWTPIGQGPVGGTRALAASRDMLYAVNQAGYLVRRPASRAAIPWSNLSDSPFAEANASVVALAAHRDILFATTSNKRLLRSNRDWLDECTGWLDILHCNNSVGLAAVDGMLFVATSDDRLWRLDLHRLQKP